MTHAQQQVKEFMVKAGQEVPAHPTQPKDCVATLRVALIQEELDELEVAFVGCTIGDGYDHVEVADAIGDLLYVVLGTAVACGINITPIFDEIHRSNMSKFIDGQRAPNGKWIKGKSYTPPNLHPIIKLQCSHS